MPENLNSNLEEAIIYCVDKGNVRNGIYSIFKEWESQQFTQQEIDTAINKMIQKGTLIEGHPLGQDPGWIMVTRFNQDTMKELRRENKKLSRTKKVMPS